MTLAQAKQSLHLECVPPVCAESLRQSLYSSITLDLSVSILKKRIIAVFFYRHVRCTQKEHIHIHTHHARRCWPSPKLEGGALHLSCKVRHEGISATTRRSDSHIVTTKLKPNSNSVQQPEIIARHGGHGHTTLTGCTTASFTAAFHLFGMETVSSEHPTATAKQESCKAATRKTASATAPEAKQQKEQPGGGRPPLTQHACP